MYELIIIDDDNGGYNIITMVNCLDEVINQYLLNNKLAVGGRFILLFSLRICGGKIYYY